jgi:hypothetical protein
LDKATLVGSDLDIGGRVMFALSRAKIPVTVCDWSYFPQLDEWQLIIATPLFDSRGPHEAISKVVSALEEEGIYSEVPIRRLFVKSPSDPLVKALQSEAKVQTEGTIHIVDYGRFANRSKQYSLIFSPYSGSGGALPARQVQGPDNLREFLEDRLHIAKSNVDQALTDLKRKPSTSIPHVRLTKREAKTHGLA